MSTRPTDGPLWAKGGGNPSTWPSLVYTNGYPYRAKVPAEDLNGVLENHGDWIDHLERGGHMADLPTAVDNTAADESFVLAPPGGLSRAWEVAEGGTAAGSIAAQPTAIAMDAQMVFMAGDVSGDGIIRAYTYDTVFSTASTETANAEWTYAMTLASGKLILQMVSNGTYLGAITNQGDWYILNAQTGALVYSGAHTVALSGCAITDQYFVAVGLDTGSNVPGRRVRLSDGNVAALPTLGGAYDAYDVAAIDSTTFVVVHAANASSDQISELLAAAPGWGWQVNPTRTFATGAVVACDGRRIYAHTGNAQTYLCSYSPANGAAGWEVALASDLPSLACDAKNVYLNTDYDGSVYVIDPQVGTLVKTWATPGASGSIRCEMATNSQYLLIANYSGALERATPYNTDLGPRRWFRRAIAPHFTQATPEVL